MLLEGSKIIKIGQLWGASASYIISQTIKTKARPILVITHSGEEAETALNDIEAFLSLEHKHSRGNHQLPEYQVMFFPPYSEAANPEAYPERDNKFILSERLRGLKQITETPHPVIICPVQALIQNVPTPEDFGKNAVILSIHQNIPLDELIRRLADNGFSRQNEIETPGEFSVRGGILDIYPYDLSLSLRIEWLGNYIESIRQFDIETQETLHQPTAVKFALVKTDYPASGEPNNAGYTLLNYLSEPTLVILKEPYKINEALALHLSDYSDWLSNRLSRYSQLHLHTLPVGNQPGEVNLNIRSLERFSSQLSNTIDELSALLSKGVKITIFCRNDAQADDARDKVKPPARAAVHIGSISYGFYTIDEKIAFINYSEIFPDTDDEPSAVESVMSHYADIKNGDFVVHFLHGIGRYRGIKKIRAKGKVESQIAVEYQDKAMLYVPRSQMGMVHKYIGSSGFGRAEPEIEKLGGKRWELKKERARGAVARLTLELLRIQAAREKESGIAYPRDTDWQKNFEMAFPYRDTPDQTTITGEVKKDMEKRRPMDRLICGDVGYGKTEIAIRAAFKAALNNKQVAILAPTTILAQQHYQNFKMRMANYPVFIDILSRFRSKEQQTETIKRLAEGKVDIIIGTHRLLQPDVRFNDLGLVIIDEEHRFGVENKEHFKRLRATVDVLTLTATPIPRTLNMALSGLREISTLTTPPTGRHPIETLVCRASPEIIHKAITRELARNGQVFFVHNRIVDIERVAERIQRIVPEAVITIAHGQMAARELESRMMQFIKGQANVLVCTNIIGSGLDIQRANTILVNNAHDFGLSDLHQLRGRVGRYKEQAFAYFIIPPDEVIPTDAHKRLKAIEEFSELGAGFKIALRDMEIRGIGNILGKEQHGHISAIGYHLYLQLLEQAVKKHTKRR